MKIRVLAALLILSSFCCFADVKATNRVSISGQSFTTSVLMKQGKIRTETTGAAGPSTVTIQDCEGHRLIHLNQAAKTYFVAPLEDQQPAGAASSRERGEVTLSVNQQDTGERKQFLGRAAKHIKGTIAAQGGSGSCASNFRVSTDGWYIDLPAAAGCAPAAEAALRNRMSSSGCDAPVTFKRSGVERPGYPVWIDTTITDNGKDFTIHQETTDIETSALDPALFLIPAGYTEVNSYRELVAGGPLQPQAPTSAPGTNATAPEERAEAVAAGASHETTDKKKGPLRIGITQVTSSADQTLATEGMQQQLVNDINFLGGAAVLLSADPNDRDASNEQAKQQGCDYVVFTNISDYKTATAGQKLGRVFNRGGLGGVGGTAAGRVEVVANVLVFQPDKPVAVLDGNTNFRGSDADSTARGLMQTEARSVMLQLKGLQKRAQ
jgi:hypothetical protein